MEIVKDLRNAGLHQAANHIEELEALVEEYRPAPRHYKYRADTPWGGDLDYVARVITPNGSLVECKTVPTIPHGAKFWVADGFGVPMSGYHKMNWEKSLELREDCPLCKKRLRSEWIGHTCPHCKRVNQPEPPPTPRTTPSDLAGCWVSDHLSECIWLVTTVDETRVWFGSLRYRPSDLKGWVYSSDPRAPIANWRAVVV